MKNSQKNIDEIKRFISDFDNNTLHLQCKNLEWNDFKIKVDTEFEWYMDKYSVQLKIVLEYYLQHKYYILFTRITYQDLLFNKVDTIYFITKIVFWNIWRI